MKVKNIEDIYPLTIVSNRYNSKIIIFNSHNESRYISTACEDEEVSYNLEDWLEKTIPTYGVNYGTGNDIWSAFEDYKIRNSKQ